MNIHKISAATIARTACLLLALTNQLLSACGKPVLPIESQTVEQLVTAGSFLNTAIDRIVWHIVALCLCDHLCKFEVIGWIRATLFYCNCDLSTDNRKDFTFCSIIFFFLMFNIGKL